MGRVVELESNSWLCHSAPKGVIRRKFFQQIS